MGSVINLKSHFKKPKNPDLIYQSKLCRIRDTIEDDLYKKSLKEDDHLAVSLSAGRYAAMKLTELLGKKETLIFFNDCINTISKTKN
tara:strand:- start:20 stop:280 length:261 start_codon:yes stop_codon:yes gene_type:complete